MLNYKNSRHRSPGQSSEATPRVDFLFMHDNLIMVDPRLHRKDYKLEPSTFVVTLHCTYIVANSRAKFRSTPPSSGFSCMIIIMAMVSVHGNLSLPAPLSQFGCADGSVYLFDVFTLGADAFEQGGLRAILAAERVTKVGAGGPSLGGKGTGSPRTSGHPGLGGHLCFQVSTPKPLPLPYNNAQLMYDCRHDGDALYHLCGGVRVAGAVDLQVRLGRRKTGRPARHYFPSRSRRGTFWRTPSGSRPSRPATCGCIYELLV